MSGPFDSIVTPETFYKNGLGTEFAIPVAVRNSALLSEPNTFSPFAGGATQQPVCNPLTGSRAYLVIVKVLPHVLGARKAAIAQAGGEPANPHDFRTMNLCDERQVWVHVNEPRYAAIARSALELDTNCDFDIDHIFNKAQALELGYAWVRACPTTQRANRSAGAGFEALQTKKARESYPVQKGSKIKELNEQNPQTLGYAYLSQFERAQTAVAYATRMHLAKMLGLAPGPTGNPAGIFKIHEILPG